MIRTSQSHPLHIAPVEVAPGLGRIGVTFAPGKTDPDAASGAWARDLAADLNAIVAWPSGTLVTLIEPHEFELLGIATLGEEARRRGLEWRHLPIRDVSVPGPAFEAVWPAQSATLRAKLAAGENIVVHCRGGLGRAGMIAARLLVEGGLDDDTAMARVRARRAPARSRRVRRNIGCERARVSRRLTDYDFLERWIMEIIPASLNPLQDRALGAFFGLAVGDALGTTIEFKPRDTYPHVTDMAGRGPFHLRPGEWTDDTSMALCLADSLIATKGSLDPIDLADRFLRWWRDGENSVNGRCFDIGNATRAALARYRKTGVPRGDDAPSTAGNGGIMRLAPAVLAAYRQPNRAIALSRAQSEVTHAAPECLDAAEVLARVLIAGIAGVGLEADHSDSAEALASPKVRAIAKGGWREKSRDEIKSSGYVVDTLEAALWAVGSSSSFEEALLKAVNLGDDADTVGAVAGQIAGAIWGYQAIPLSWRERLAWSDKIVERAIQLMA